MKDNASQPCEHDDLKKGKKRMTKTAQIPAAPVKRSEDDSWEEPRLLRNHLEGTTRRAGLFEWDRSRSRNFLSQYGAITAASFWTVSFLARVLSFENIETGLWSNVEIG